MFVTVNTDYVLSKSSIVNCAILHLQAVICASGGTTRFIYRSPIIEEISYCLPTGIQQNISILL